MKGRAGIPGSNTGGAPTDLLVCFPSRAHLAVMPKPICSPSRPADPTKRHPARPTNRGRSSPLFRSKTGKDSCGGSASNDIADEPTSPTVTCAGQIKIRPRSSSGSKPATSSSRDGKGWFSAVEEIQKLQRHSKKPLMQFLGALRGLPFDLRCFGSFHGTVDCSTDEEGADEEEEEEVEEDKDLERSASASGTMFSEWFMVLENQTHELKEEEIEKEEDGEEVAPPPNALLLMRSRSAPAKGEIRTVVALADADLGAEMIQEEEEEKEKEKERLLLMSYAPDFMKLSTEIAKETWVVGNFDPLARSRSWKR